LRSVQVALEAGLAMRGGFAAFEPAGGPPGMDVRELLFLRLGTRGVVKPETIAPQTFTAADKTRSEITPALFADRAWQRLERLLHHFGNSDNGYVSRANPGFGRPIMPNPMTIWHGCWNGRRAGRKAKMALVARRSGGHERSRHH
ncbi:MAG: hypothetical protein HC779_08010, partial [Phyllobacteriaceae bacterium]|nr:hypothetical protein [Phyllobacteriaceae bacterium]